MFVCVKKNTVKLLCTMNYIMLVSYHEFGIQSVNHSKQDETRGPVSGGTLPSDSGGRLACPQVVKLPHNTEFTHKRVMHLFIHIFTHSFTRHLR